MKFILLSVLVCLGAGTAQAFEGVVHPKDLPSTQGRIIGGQGASDGQFPHQVAIIGTTPTGNFLCGGSVISETHILTAAHCAAGATSFTIRLGSTTLEAPLVIRTTKTAVVHANYNPNNINNDIAVIKLNEPLTFTSVIRPVRLPTYSQASNSFALEVVTVSGWGKTSDTSGTSSKLNYVQLSIITNAQCSITYPGGIIISSTICASQSGSKSTCSGDSGGALVLYDKAGVPTQIGIVSFVASSSCIRGPSGYARVTSFLSWISTNTGIQILP